MEKVYLFIASRIQGRDVFWLKQSLLYDNVDLY